MPTKKKTKTKAKSAKKPKSKSAAPKKPPKKAARKPAPKKAASKKSAKAKPKTARKAAPAVPPPITPPPPPGERVGTVVHYYGNLSVAIIELDTGSLRVGDVIHIKGHTTDFSQPVESMEIDHAHVNEAGPGKSFGVRVKDHARENDVVYKVEK